MLAAIARAPSAAPAVVYPGLALPALSMTSASLLISPFFPTRACSRSRGPSGSPPYPGLLMLRCAFISANQPGNSVRVEASSERRAATADAAACAELRSPDAIAESASAGILAARTAYNTLAMPICKNSPRTPAKPVENGVESGTRTSPTLCARCSRSVSVNMCFFGAP